MNYDVVRKMINWMPDPWFIKLWYRKNMGYFPNLKNPKTFNEKIQWLKLNDRNPLYTSLADKYSVRNYIAKTIGEEYLIELFSVWDSADDIDFDVLPTEFVLKCTHDSGSVIVCRDKEKLDKAAAVEKLKKSYNHNSYDFAKEWPYKDIKPRIIAEKLLRQTECPEKGIIDYKFFCFNGKSRFIYISQGLENHATANISFYDLDGKPMPFHRSDYKPFDEAPIPTQMKKMSELADVIATDVGCDFLRVDFYEIDGHIYFSEITFFPCSGVMPIVPSEWDKKIGDMIVLKEK